MFSPSLSLIYYLLSHLVLPVCAQAQDHLLDGSPSGPESLEKADSSPSCHQLLIVPGMGRDFMSPSLTQVLFYQE